MKKTLFITIILALLLTFVFVGCDEKPNDNNLVDATVRFSNGFTYAIEAEEIEQTISVKMGTMEIYSSNKTSTKKGNLYEVVEEEKQLNKTTDPGEGAYTQVTTTLNAQKAATFTSSLKLKEEYFKQGYDIQTSKLTCEILDGKFDDVFSLSEQHPVVTNVKLEIALDGNNVAEMKVTFVSGNYDVIVTLTFKYATQQTAA